MYINNNCQNGIISPLSVSCVTQVLLPSGSTVPTGPQGPKGDTGATGATGAQGIQGLPGVGQAGTSGSNVLWNPVINIAGTGNVGNVPGYVNTGLGASDNVTFSIPAQAFQNVGDVVKVTAIIKPPQPTQGLTYAQLILNGTAFGTIQAPQPSTTQCVLELEISLQVVAGQYFLWATITSQTYNGVLTTAENQWQAAYAQQIPQVIAYTLSNPVAFVVDFSNIPTAGAAGTTFVKACQQKIASTSSAPQGAFVPIYTAPTGGATYTNTNLANVALDNLTVNLDGTLLFPTLDFTYATNGTQGTITWVGVPPVSTSRLAIIPV